MRQTLFFIPHWLFEGPLLIAWLIIGVAMIAHLFSKHGNSNEVWSFLPVFAIVAVALHLLPPQLEVTGVNPADPAGPEIVRGIAVRGYGVFLLLGIVCGVGITLMRCRYIGVSPDDIIGLGFWMMVCGIAGARLFYVIQKRDEFFDGAPLQDVIFSMVNMTRGGLVVYGSLIGGSIAAFVFLKVNKLPILKIADLMAPGMVLGLAIGRLGCLMNGCCYGGVCEAPLPSVTFPPGSAPYMQQLSQGDLIGIHGSAITDPESDFDWEVESVLDGSIAAELGLEAGDEIVFQFPDSRRIEFQLKNPEVEFEPGKQLAVFVDSKQKGRLVLPVDQLPNRSRSTHPTQIYSSINAGLLCLLLWFYWTLKRSDGEVFALMLICYSIGRFLMELIRQDELGQFGTQLTISQLVSVLAVLVGFSLFAMARAWGVDSHSDLAEPASA